MIEHLRKADNTLRKYLDKLGIPTLAQMDKAVDKGEEKLWNFVFHYKVKDERSIFIPVLLAVCFAVVTLGSTVTMYLLNVPEIAKDGLRLTTLICVVGMIGVALHLGFNKIFGED